MTAASATPQQMRDRLLQAIDGQSNQIHNMVAVLEVISHLEKYPITKEALEETRLGKLINDVRKKTNDEDLAKRAKKLLRNWQKLIEPGQTEGLPKGGPGTPGSANGGAHTCRTDTSPPAVSPIGKPVSELKSKNDIYNSYSAKSEKSGSRKRKGVSHGEGHQSLEPKSSLSWHALPEENLHLQHSTGTLESLQDSSHTPKPASHNVCTAPLGQGFSEAAKTESDSVNPCFEGKRRKRYRPRDYTVNLVGQPTEESTKPVRLKDRRLTFDPVTGQIKPLTHKESYQGEEPLGSPPPKSQRTDLLQQNPSAPLPSPFQQTNWKELYRNEIIQSYLNIQSNVLTSSGAQTPGAHFFMTEYLKREERYIKESRKTHVLVAESSDTDLPGVSREVTTEDLHRIHKEHWPGVNGCYDTKDNWYDWTQCISLDPHGDESKLNILPYVCLD
ncbi:hypothetical protein MATL_G00028290 [Megalops atlanticus]|uniref:Mediator of RNA polymerase II transcription subunit 26 n=1 Tax=Megalops atlanticus TaxID=7932 RepID=A0A9D3TCR4_MEGAT|nr:hypothetical protein MATL_G00028290 [Megalops atlanticus]